MFHKSGLYATMIVFSLSLLGLGMLSHLVSFFFFSFMRIEGELKKKRILTLELLASLVLDFSSLEPFIQMAGKQHVAL